VPIVPTYDYQCRKCGRTYEVIHSMLADGPTTCEQCGGQLRRVIHPAGIIFKGSGFYRTDSRTTSKPPAGDKSSPKPDSDSSSKGPDSRTSGADGGTSGQSSTATGSEKASGGSKE
jgi:putative FmdB family regulatory protein